MATDSANRKDCPSADDDDDDDDDDGEALGEGGGDDGGEVVDSAMNDLRDPNLVGEGLKLRMHCPRAVQLVSRARRCVLQRSVDAGLLAELVSIRSTVDEIVSVVDKGNPEQAMVTLRFSAQSASKLKLRFEAVKQKASDELKVNHKDTIGFIEQKVQTIAMEIKHACPSVFLQTIQPAFCFLAESLASGKFDPEVAADDDDDCDDDGDDDDDDDDDDMYGNTERASWAPRGPPCM